VSANASSNVIHVPKDFPTIQEAIDNASSGATILVANGTYIAHFNISKSLSLVGENRDTTIIDGYDAEYVISIMTEQVNIEGFTIKKSAPRLYDSGIRVERGRAITINNTKIIGTYAGITLYSSNNNVFLDNIVANNTNGITLLYSNYNVFSNNVLSGNSEGVSLYYSNNNVFFGNTLFNNVEGVLLSSASNRNSLYHNNFRDPVTVSGGSTNIWSRSGEGNYWVYYNFTGRDLNGDGIGDEPYSVDEYNEDNYPLMGMFSDYSVIFKSETYHVTIISNSTVSDFRFEIGKETGNKIVNFNAVGENHTTGFCRIMIPNSLMDYPLIVLDREGEVTTFLLSASNETNTYLYFTYVHDDQSVTVISSKSLQLYNELLSQYTKLQTDFVTSNATYQALLTNYNTMLQAQINSLNASYQAMLNTFSFLLENFSQLQNNYLALNSSFQKNLVDQSENMQNVRNLTYIFAATTGAFLITVAYLSNRVSAISKPKAYVVEEKG
jgi:parallel beta-helix repeat protein